MNARQLEVFRTVMRCGTLTSAARALHVSQPALSQVLLHTEDQLGLKLFQRLGGRLVPTPEAEQLFPDADRLFRDLDNLRRFADELKQGKGGLVRLAASAPPALSILPAALRAFRAECPRVRLLSYVVPAAVMAEMLVRGEADLGIAMNDTPMPLIETEMIGASEVVCVLREDHPLVARPFVAVADLAGETLISYRASSLPGMLLDRAFGEAGTRLRPEVEIDVSIVALPFVQQGMGVALVDGLLPWGEFPGLVTRPFRPAIELPLCLLRCTRRPMSRHQETLRQRLREAACEYAANPAATGVLRAASP